MKKIKVMNNSFEIFYLEDDKIIYQRQKEMIENLISLIGDYTCFIEYSCNDKAFLKYKILNYIKHGKITSKIKVAKFEGINDEMFEDRFVVFYFMPKDYKWNDFISHKYILGNIFKKYGIKLILALNDLGSLSVRYNPIYDEQIKNIIWKENIK